MLSFVPPASPVLSGLSFLFTQLGEKVLPLFSRETLWLRQRETWVSPLLPETLAYGGVVATELHSSWEKAHGEARRQITFHLSC